VSDGVNPVATQTGGTSARDALDGAVTAIAAAGCETPRLDAELLLCSVLGVSRERLLVDRDLVVAGEDVRALQAAVRRRAVEREPVAYILGARHFRQLELRVDRRVLVPRPESELLVEWAIELAPGARVLDVGTGSGAIALAIKHERPDLEVSASDVSDEALDVARANAARLELDVAFLRADLLDGVPDDLDALVANLPYVAIGERAQLAPEIVRHEPPAALFSGEDGLDAIRALSAQLARRERPAAAALEVGAGQAPSVAAMLRASGFETVECIRDLAGMERVVTAERARR
jgi:release factor glutamine methyltransferase